MPTRGETWFANYDAGNSNDSAWNIRSIFTAIDKHFSGNRVLLLADCCHSGALYEECRRRNRDDGDERAGLRGAHFLVFAQHVDRQLDV